MQKKILQSFENVGNGPLGTLVLRIENVEREKKLKDALSKARESQLVVVVLIATVTFAATFHPTWRIQKRPRHCNFS